MPKLSFTIWLFSLDFGLSCGRQAIRLKFDIRPVGSALIPGDANRLISSKSLYINDRRIEDPRSEISRSDLVDGHLAVLKYGKNSVVLYIDEIPKVTQKAT